MASDPQGEKDMKAMVPKSALVNHRKALKLARLPKSMAEKATVEITLSERMIIVGPGFAEKLDCEAIEWGNVFLPYPLWQRVIQSAETLRDETVEFSIQDGSLTIGPMRIGHPEIRVRRLERLGLEVPLNAGRVDFIRLFFRYDMQRLEAAGLWNFVLWAAKDFRLNIGRAWKPLAEYGIRLEEVAEMVGRKLGMKEQDRDGFLKLLYPKKDRLPPRT
jgi:hypothetical protein